MLRNVLTFFGLLTLVIGLVIWQFGFFSRKVAEITTQVERETAVARAESKIRDTERRAAELHEKARALRIEARAKELAVARDAEQAAKTRQAMTALAGARWKVGHEAGRKHWWNRWLIPNWVSRRSRELPVFEQRRAVLKDLESDA